MSVTREVSQSGSLRTHHFYLEPYPLAGSFSSRQYFLSHTCTDQCSAEHLSRPYTHLQDSFSAALPRTLLCDLWLCWPPWNLHVVSSTQRGSLAPWHPSRGCSLETPKPESWGNPGVYLIDLPFLSPTGFTACDLQRLENCHFLGFTCCIGCFSQESESCLCYFYLGRSTVLSWKQRSLVRVTIDTLF